MLLPLVWRTYFLQGIYSFTEADIPDLTGKVAIVTGANTGLGFETARALAEHGATVVLGCRNQERCQAAADRINEVCKVGGSAIPASLDLSDPKSVAVFATIVKENHDKVDYLINNGGIMTVPESRNDAGIEMTLATNHIGHYLLTGHLIDLLKKAKGRIVNHSSSASADFMYKVFHMFEPSDSQVPWSGINMTGYSHMYVKLFQLTVSHMLFQLARCVVCMRWPHIMAIVVPDIPDVTVSDYEGHRRPFVHFLKHAHVDM